MLNEDGRTVRLFKDAYYRAHNFPPAGLILTMDDSWGRRRWEHSTTDFVQTLRAADTAGQGRAAWRLWVRALAESYGQGPDSPEREALEAITDLMDDRAEDASEFLRLRKSLLALFDDSWHLGRIRRIAPAGAVGGLTFATMPVMNACRGK